MDSFKNSTGFERLTSSNYYAWKSRAEEYLIIKDLWEYVFEDEPKVKTSPTEEEKKAIEAWRVKDRKAKAIISWMVDDSIKWKFEGAVSAKHLWLKIKAESTKAAEEEIAILENKLESTKLKGGDHETYLTKLRDLFQKL